MMRLRWLLRWRRQHDDLTREMQAHVAERVGDLVEDGMTEADARAQARREFGNATLQIERSREVWGAPWIWSVWQDLRYAVRSLGRQPGFTLSAVGILAIGIGLVTAIFMLFNGRMLRPWPVATPSSIAIVRPVAGPTQQYGSLSNVEYRYLRDNSRTLTHLATWMPGGGPVTYGDTTMSVQSNFVSANYFDMLGVGMRMGRAFLPEEEDYTSPRAVAIISERLWREYFGAPASIVGNTILVYGHPFTVVGVAHAGFFDIEAHIRRDLWMPRPSVALMPFGSLDAQLKSMADPRQGGTERVAGRLAPGITRVQALAEIDVLGRQFRSTIPMDTHGYTLHNTRPVSSGSAPLMQMPQMAVVFGALLLVMLLACANVGNLILARGLARQREVTIRLSLGASRRRVARQLLTEALLLSVAASVVGLSLSALALQWFVRSQGTPLLAQPDPYVPDSLVVVFTLATAVLATLASGVMPALRSTRVSLATQAADRSAGRTGAGWLRTMLLSAQLAVSMVLLVGAGLFTRAASHALTFDPGFAIHDVQAISLQLPEGAPAERSATFYRTLHDALETDEFPPIAFSAFSAITQAHANIPIRRDDETRETGRALLVRDVSAQYFGVLEIPLVEGRTFSDDEYSQDVVVNESAARILWPGSDVVGKRIVIGGGDTATFHTVVGVAKDVPTLTLSEIHPVVYRSMSPRGLLLVRDQSPAIVDRIAAAARGIEPAAGLTARPLSDDITMATRGLVTAGQFAWGIGLLALALATIGAFGVFAYMVEERRREIGVRMALGARPRQVVRTVIGGARRPLVFGLGAGLVLSLAAAPLLGRFLYGLSPFDPITYAGIAAILTFAALLATWIPARRAARIDPAVTLRGD